MKDGFYVWGSGLSTIKRAVKLRFNGPIQRTLPWCLRRLDLLTLNLEFPQKLGVTLTVDDPVELAPIVRDQAYPLYHHVINHPLPSLLDQTVIKGILIPFRGYDFRLYLGAVTLNRFPE